MRPRAGLLALFGLVILTVPAWSQTNRLREPQSSGNAAGPDQPLRPQTPTIVPRVRQVPGEQPPAPPKPPFTLTPQEEAQVDRVLNLWEKQNREIKTFDCQFKRWIYDGVFGPANQAKFIEIGVIKYAAPDRGMFRVERAEVGGKEVPIDDSRAEHWVSDGKSIYEYKYTATPKQLIEHKLPPELQGKAIADSPLPFLFGADAKKLKERYFLRLLAPPPNVKDQICLEAYPRFQQDAANFHHAQLVIKTEGMTPFGLMLVQPNEKDRTSYQFYDIVVNDPLRLFKGDPFRPFTPLGWQKIVEEPPAAPQQASRPTTARQR